MKKASLLLIGLVISFSAYVSAAESTNPPPMAESGHDHHRMGPPQEAIDACVNKAEGDVVSFVSPRGDTIQATCQTKPVGLVAVPDHPPQGGKAEQNKTQ